MEQILSQTLRILGNGFRSTERRGKKTAPFDAANG
jgi:hypothetical protein